jgi:hypothetical protein
MKQRWHKPRKQFRQPRKLLPTTPTPPLDWLTQLEQPTRTRRASSPAISEIVQPILPPRVSNAVVDEMGGMTEPFPPAADQAAFKGKGEGAVRADTTLMAGTDRFELQGGATKSVIERRLSEQPADFRDIARALSRKFKSQANELKRQRPNDPDRIAQRDSLLVLSNGMAVELTKLADNLDQSIKKASNGKLEPVFLGGSCSKASLRVYAMAQ